MGYHTPNLGWSPGHMLKNQWRDAVQVYHVQMNMNVKKQYFLCTSLGAALAEIRVLEFGYEKLTAEFWA
jgi:hypothetical protein